MGPCQGGFCTFRAEGVLAERAVATGGPLTNATLDATLADFLAERFRGTRPIAWGRQLQELWLTSGLYTGILGVESLPGAETGATTRIAARSGGDPAGEATDAVG
jgi:glycerol-3-phosphate dehydrogenase